MPKLILCPLKKELDAFNDAKMRLKAAKEDLKVTGFFADKDGALRKLYTAEQEIGLAEKILGPKIDTRALKLEVANLKIKVVAQIKNNSKK